MRENDVAVDIDTKTVTIYIPRPEVYDLIVDPNDFILDETSKGLLAFGDIKMTLEEAFYIESQAVSVLKGAAEAAELTGKAEATAEKKLEELFSQLQGLLTLIIGLSFGCINPLFRKRISTHRKIPFDDFTKEKSN